MSKVLVMDQVGRAVTWAGSRLVGAYEDAGLLTIPVLVTGIVLFALQRRYPIARPQRGAYATSAAWTLFAAPVSAVLVALEFAALTWLFRGPLAWSGFDVIQDWPIALRVIVGLLVVDATDYWSHRMRHSVPVLWRFHSIHHSAPHLSFWAALRSHPVDVVIGSTVLALPFLIVRESAMVFALVFTIRTVLFYTHHSNLRVRLGRVDALMVTPQWHRLHHSTQPEHYDRNFGATLSLWDRMFGTAAVPQPDDFPPVGLDKKLCPPDADSVTGVPRAFAKQLMFPFTGLLPTSKNPSPLPVDGSSSSAS